MKQLYQPASSELTVPYTPEITHTLYENPPRFTWMPAKIEDCTYILEISASSDFKTNTLKYPTLPYNYHTPDESLKPGTWYWRYAMHDADGQTEWSNVRSFVIADDLPKTPLPARGKRYNNANTSHPRLWLSGDEVVEFRKNLEKNPDHCGWKKFMELSVQPWLQQPMPSEPAFYPNGRTVDLWRASYIGCQELLYAIRHLSVAGVILKDKAIIAKAREYLLTASSWNPEGSTSRSYNDEAAFRMIQCLAWGYDWLYNELSADERKKVATALETRHKEVYVHVVEHSQVHISVFDSHAIRSISWVMTLAAIAMNGESTLADKSLDYAIDYLGTLYSPWADSDGGWAEGGMYWNTAMAAVSDALQLIRKYTGIDLFKRPFFQKTGDFPLYCYAHDTSLASFGDQSNLGDKPTLKTGYNIRVFAGVTGNPLYQWYLDKIRERTPVIKKTFFDWGWWDFHFDELVYQHDFPQIQGKAPSEQSSLNWFKGIGWAAIHANMANPDEHIMFLTKCSPYGSVSHSHGDQSSFLIHAFGKPLAILSGQYVGFNTSMHMNWRRQTKSHNTLLIDGMGQYAGKDKILQVAAQGKIELAEQRKDHYYIKEDATKAYLHNVPYLKRFMREIYFVNQSYFVIVDTVDLEQECEISWNIHALNKMEIQDNKFLIKNDHAELAGTFIHASSGPLQLSQNDEYDGVDPKEYKPEEKQWHLSAKSKKAKKHRIVTQLVPQKNAMNRYVINTFDDQGHIFLCYYFIDNGHTFSVLVEKDF